MPCTCHGPTGEVVSGKVTPDDPCTVCASKHVNLAASAWNEFTYEWDNRLFAAGHLRLAAEHLRKNHRHLALKARDIAVYQFAVPDGPVGIAAGESGGGVRKED